MTLVGLHRKYRDSGLVIYLKEYHSHEMTNLSKLISKAGKNDKNIHIDKQIF